MGSVASAEYMLVQLGTCGWATSGCAKPAAAGAACYRAAPANSPDWLASTAMLRALPMKDSAAMMLHATTMSRHSARSVPPGDRARIHMMGGRMKVTGMRPMEDMRPLGWRRRRTEDRGSHGLELAMGQERLWRQAGATSAAVVSRAHQARHVRHTRPNPAHISSPKKGSRQAMKVTAAT